MDWTTIEFRRLFVNIGESENRVDAYHQWTITFSANHEGNESAEALTSPIFSFKSKNEYKWQLCWLLNNDSENNPNKDFISLMLKSCNNFDVVASLGLCMFKNAEKNPVASYFPKTNETFTPKLEWGSTHFVKKSDLQYENYPPMFRITCLLIVDETYDINQQLDFIMTENRNEEFDDFENLLHCHEFSDVTFQVNGKEFHAHKAILAIRSPVFAAMFSHDMLEKQQNMVNIEDIDSEVFEELLRFIYAGKVKASQMAKFTVELLGAADKYNIQKLKTMCEKILYRGIHKDNAVEYLNIAEQCNAMVLRTLSIKFIATHAKDMTERAEFKSLGTKHPSLMYEIFCALAEDARK